MGFALSDDRAAVAPELGPVTPFFAIPSEIRRIIYTTNAVESLNLSLRKIIKTRGAFPSAEAGLNLLFLPLRNVIGWEVVQESGPDFEIWLPVVDAFRTLVPDAMLAMPEFALR